MLIIFPHLAFGLRLSLALFQLFFGAEAVIGPPLLYQLLGIRQVHVLPLGLHIGAVSAADIPVKPDILHGAVDHIHCTFYIPVLIRILNAQNEYAVVLFCHEIGIQGRAQPPQMQIPGGAGGKSGSYFHNSTTYFD